MTNLEKLHAAILNPETWDKRKSGKTTIQIHELVGEIQVGQNKEIHVLIKNHQNFKWLICEIKWIFGEQAIFIHKRGQNKESGRETWIVQFEDKVKKLHIIIGKTKQQLYGIKADSSVVSLVDY